MERDGLDPVDLMLLGETDDAAKMYLNLYAEAVKEEDGFIAPYLLSQLHFCVAAKVPGCVPEDSTEEVERMIFAELRKRAINVDKRMVQDQLEIAKNNIVSAKKGSEQELRKWV